MQHHRLTTTLLSSLVIGFSLTACASDPALDEGSTCAPIGNGKADGAGGEAIPFRMPDEIVAYERENGWSRMHVKFHVERRWDLMSAGGRAWASSQGFSRAPLQEGVPTSGLEFLAMHRHMIMELVDRFPEHAELFDGWDTPPLDPDDADNPVLSGDEFSPYMLAAIEYLSDDESLAEFADDDEFALYLQTNLRPTRFNPGARSSDRTAGIHNYLHVRFTDSDSPIDVGDPAKNLENMIFWRIHGWIDSRWSAFRAAKGLDDELDDTYQAAIEEAMHWMHQNSGPGKADGASEDCVDVPDDVVETLFN